MKALIKFASLTVLMLILLYRPLAWIQSPEQEFSENKILIEYEMYGCGSLVIRVIEGGEEMASLFQNEYPDIAVDEVMFTEKSDQPADHIDSCLFEVAGFASKYQYIIEGNVVGAVRGAPDCCGPSVAYNEIVPEFKVTKWYTVNYIPYYETETGWVYLFGLVLFVSAIGTLIGLVLLFRRKWIDWKNKKI